MIQSFIEKDIEDTLNILEYLYSREVAWVTTEELRQVTGLEQRMILKYLSEIKKNIRFFEPKEVSLTYEKSKGYKFQVYTKTNFIRLRLSILNASLNLSVINKIFLAGSVNMVKFSMDHYVSLGTLKRKIKKINLFISDHGFKITSQDGAYFFKGNEKSIRLFISEAYWNLYGGIQWPFSNVDQRKINMLIDRVSEMFEYPLSLALKRRISYNYSVGLIRYVHHDVITLEDSTEWQKLKEINKQLITNMKFDFFSLFYNEGVVADDEIHFHLSRLQAASGFYNNQTFAETIIHEHKLKETEIFIATTQLLNHLLKKVNVKNEKFSTEILRSFSIYAFSLHYKAFIFQEVSPIDTSVDELLKPYVQLNKMVEELYDELNNQLHFTLFQQKYMLINQYMYLFSELFPLNHLEPEIVVYFDESLDKIREKLVKNMMQNFFGEQYKLTIYGSNEVNLAKQVKVDLIISNSSMERIVDYYPAAPIIVLKKSILNISEEEIITCKSVLEIVSRNIPDEFEKKKQFDQLKNVFYKISGEQKNIRNKLYRLEK